MAASYEHGVDPDSGGTSMSHGGSVGRNGGVSSTRAVCLLLGTLLAAAIPAHRAHAAISAASVGTSTVTGSGNDGDGSTTGSASILVNNGAQLNTRMEFNVNSDAGFLGSDDQSGSASHKITVNATAAGGYRLDISTTRVGDVNRINDDIFGCDGQAHISAVTGTTNIALNSGTLNITPAVDLNNGSSTAETPFSQTSGTA